MSRYQTQLNLNNFDDDAQQKLKNANILLVGAGGLGAACLPYLVGAGIGKITIVDPDKVELSNLHRQVIYNEKQVGTKKTHAAKEALSYLNSDVEITTLCDWLGFSDAMKLVSDYDLVIDGTDNYNAKFSLNDACIHHNIAMLSASISGLFGYLGFFGGQGMPSYRALVNEPQIEGLNCSDQGVLGSVSGLFGVMLAHEAIKYISNFEKHLDKILMLDLLDYDLRKMMLPNEFNSEFKAFDFKEGGFADKSLLVDVRSEDEYSAGHFESAYHLPIDLFETHISNFEEKYDKHAPMTLYCKSGKRAFNVAVMLQRRGFTQVYLSKRNFPEI